MIEQSSEYLDPLVHGCVLVHVGEMYEAELETGNALEASPGDLGALSLLGKIKHIRGELSEAVACWAAIHASPQPGTLARLHLDAMLDLARDPERGAGAFLAIGQHELVRKPMAYLELEEAFRLFVARRPEEARAQCVRVAKRYEERDREVHKLSVLAEARLAELSGDLEGAATLLEKLGQRRGFETDADRIQALVDVYERIGGPDRLRAAVNVCRYLERNHAGYPVLGRLASLYRRLGEEALAAEYGRRQLEAFRLVMHRPSFAEIVHVAARRYLPLRLLLAASHAGVRSPAGGALALEDPNPREKALAAALQGSPDEALRVFAGHESLLAKKYRGELLWSAGDEAAAKAVYAEVLAESPPDLHVLRLLLGEARRPRWVDDLLEGPLADPLEGALAQAVEANPRDPRLWRAFATLLEHLPSTDGRLERAKARADGLEAVARHRVAPIGRVLAAAVFHFVGRPMGLVHEVWAERVPVDGGRGGVLPPDQVLGNVTAEMRAGVQNIFVAVREYARATFPDKVRDLKEFGYTFKITKEDEPSHGSSAGLPTAMAFLSVFLQRPVPQTIAFTGAVVADAHDVLVLQRVGDIEHKVKGAYHRDLAGLVLPEANRADMEQGHLVPAAVQESVCRYASTLDDAVRLAFGPDVFL